MDWKTSIPTLMDLNALQEAGRLAEGPGRRETLLERMLKANKELLAFQRGLHPVHEVRSQKPSSLKVCDVLCSWRLIQVRHVWMHRSLSKLSVVAPCRLQESLSLPAMLMICLAWHS